MRVAPLPGKLPGGLQLFPPLAAQTLRPVAGGLDAGLPQVGIIPLPHLAALAACTVLIQGIELPVLLLFVGGQRRPVAVEAAKILGQELGLGGSAHRPENLRALIFHLLRLAPHCIVDSATFEFLQGRMLQFRGERLSDLSDAIGLILVEGREIHEMAFPVAAPPAPTLDLSGITRQR